MKSIAFPIIFHSTTRNLMLKLLKEYKKYSVNTYTQVEISLNTCRNTLDFMCDLELFSKIRSPTRDLLIVENLNALLLISQQVPFTVLTIGQLSTTTVARHGSIH